MFIINIVSRLKIIVYKQVYKHVASIKETNIFIKKIVGATSPDFFGFLES